MAPKQPIPWLEEVALDVFAAVASAASAAPIILTIDRAVVQAAAGTESLSRAILDGFLQLVRRPHHLLRQVGFWMTVGVYGVTYTTANLTDTVCERTLDHNDPKSAYIHATAKLVCTTAVNMSAGVAKDAAFARMYGSKASTGPTPRLTYGLFALRDVLTIGGGFIVPPLVASALVSSGAIDEQRAPAAAQIISPMGMQLVCTPLHLGALNVYNMPDASVGERASDVGKTLPQATVARMFRFCAAYGIGGLMNKSILKHGREHLAGKHGAERAPEPKVEVTMLRRRSSAVLADGVET